MKLWKLGVHKRVLSENKTGESSQHGSVLYPTNPSFVVKKMLHTVLAKRNHVMSLPFWVQIKTLKPFRALQPNLIKCQPCFLFLTLQRSVFDMINDSLD